MWSDSSIALHWIVSSKHKSQFVRNRVNSVNTLSVGFRFRRIDSESNPADLITCGVSAKTFFSLS